MNCLPRTQNPSLSFQSGTPQELARDLCWWPSPGWGKGLMAAFPSNPELGKDDAFLENCFQTLKENYRCAPGGPMGRGAAGSFQEAPALGTPEKSGTYG